MWWVRQGNEQGRDRECDEVVVDQCTYALNFLWEKFPLARWEREYKWERCVIVREIRWDRDWKKSERLRVKREKWRRKTEKTVNVEKYEWKAVYIVDCEEIKIWKERIQSLWLKRNKSRERIYNNVVLEITLSFLPLNSVAWERISYFC